MRERPKEDTSEQGPLADCSAEVKNSRVSFCRLYWVRYALAYVLNPSNGSREVGKNCQGVLLLRANSLRNICVCVCRAQVRNYEYLTSTSFLFICSSPSVALSLVFLLFHLSAPPVPFVSLLSSSSLNTAFGIGVGSQLLSSCL